MDWNRPVTAQKNLLICGHRGDRTGTDENTMAAFRRAVDAGVELLETDLHMTADRQIVLRHDGFVEGAGRIGDCTLEELRKAKPELPLLEELCILAEQHPALGLLIELKDVPPSSPGGGVPGTDPGLSCAGDAFAVECAERAAEILLSHHLGSRVWILSFSGKLLETVYRKYGRAFHYHAFYPWFIMGKMETDPADFCELACMQHRYLDQNGAVRKYEDPMCPESWWREVLRLGLAPIGAPSLDSFENYDEAVRRGCRMINSNDPAALQAHFLDAFGEQKPSVR